MHGLSEEKKHGTSKENIYLVCKMSLNMFILYLIYNMGKL